MNVAVTVKWQIHSSSIHPVTIGALTQHLERIQQNLFISRSSNIVKSFPTWWEVIRREVTYMECLNERRYLFSPD
jgi:hypothetical protein